MGELSAWKSTLFQFGTETRPHRQPLAAHEGTADDRRDERAEQCRTQADQILDPDEDHNFQQGHQEKHEKEKRSHTEE